MIKFALIWIALYIVGMLVTLGVLFDRGSSGSGGAQGMILWTLAWLVLLTVAIIARSRKRRPSRS